MEQENLNFLRKDFEKQKQQERHRKEQELEKELLKTKTYLIGPAKEREQAMKRQQKLLNEKLEAHMDHYHKFLEKKQFENHGGSARAADERIKKLVQEQQQKQIQTAKEIQNKQILDKMQDNKPMDKQKENQKELEQAQEREAEKEKKKKRERELQADKTRQMNAENAKKQERERLREQFKRSQSQEKNMNRGRGR